MALIRFQHLDPVRHLLALQQELDRFQRNPGFSLGPSGQGGFPSVNIFDERDGTVVVAELPGVDPQALQVGSQGKTLTISGKRRRETRSNPSATIGGIAPSRILPLDSIARQS